MPKRKSRKKSKPLSGLAKTGWAFFTGVILTIWILALRGLIEEQLGATNLQVFITTTIIIILGLILGIIFRKRIFTPRRIKRTLKSA